MKIHPRIIILLSIPVLITSCSNYKSSTTLIPGSVPLSTESTNAAHSSTMSPTQNYTTKSLPDDRESFTIPDPVYVPEVIPPILDGIHSPSEWTGAAVDFFADGSELLFMHANGYIYLGVRAKEPRMIAANVLIHHGDQIYLMHSSAALGTAVYKQNASDWQQTQDFTWQCRSTSMTDVAQSERVAFLQQEGWLAANARMGTPNELEYQIKIPDQDYRIAVVYIKSTRPYEKVPWPPGLDDACIQPTQSGLPKILEFSPDQWRVLQLLESN